MNWIKDHYGSDLDIYITENGFSDFLGNLDDQHRIYYLSKVVHIIDVERGWSGANEHYTQLNSDLNYYQTRPRKDIYQGYPLIYILKSPKKDISYHFLEKDILGI
jgi:hypothetical protein